MRRWLLWLECILAIAVCFGGCGGKTPLGGVDAGEPVVLPEPSEERCNQLDDDLDGQVDESFRDTLGRYSTQAHCGACGNRCDEGAQQRCSLVGNAMRCVETQCAPGFALSRDGRCVSAWGALCLTCLGDADCGTVATAACEEIGAEQICTVGCDAGVPDGYECIDGRIVPGSGSCRCEPGVSFVLACALQTEEGDLCAGSASCTEGILSACLAAEDVCDGEDNDCDGVVDEAFVDERGAYSVDPNHCGRCGVDCRRDGLRDLVCGGDPLAPTCVLDCPDTRDGLQNGDFVDADGDIANGCECQWTSAIDEPGPLPSEENERPLDTNCDGADGVVVQSFYVSPDGDDTAIGSPTRPFLTITRGLEAASASLELAAPRPHVFVASGTYVETPLLPPGVLVHGGYRRDFRALDPQGFRSELRAPLDATTPGRAALLIEQTGSVGTVTLVEGIRVVGADAQGPDEPAFGVFSWGVGEGRVVLRNMEIFSGAGADGANGDAGRAGTQPSDHGSAGDLPRAAVENRSNRCRAGAAANRVEGGASAVHRCANDVTSGGDGAGSGCPARGDRQASGSSAPGGASGGSGGNDLFGPIVGRGYGCPGDICCGLSDFEVPTDFQGPADGAHGRGGTEGRPGDGCGDAVGQLDANGWRGGSAQAGSGGSDAFGGGGGGAGGGVVMDYYDGFCEFADGLGGGGGGGGAGGCGGGAGLAGASGAPSIGVVSLERSLVVQDSLIGSGGGGRGGDGGAGGSGGAGSEGGAGGMIARQDQTTPTLAGAYPGGRGGNGGDGGDGGGGGGGCGGSSLGVWLPRNASAEVARRLEVENRFLVPRQGSGGRGGGSASRVQGADGIGAAVFVEGSR